MIFIRVLSLLSIFDEFHYKSYLYIWKLSRDDSGMVQDIFRNHFGLRNNLKNECWAQTLFFIFLKTSILSVPQTLTFCVTNLEIHLVEYVHVDHTDRFDLRSHFVLILKIFTKHPHLGKNTFFLDSHEHGLIHWRYIFKSSPMLGSSRRL